MAEPESSKMKHSPISPLRFAVLSEPRFLCHSKLNVHLGLFFKRVNRFVFHKQLNLWWSAGNRRPYDPLHVWGVSVRWLLRGTLHLVALLGRTEKKRRARMEIGHTAWPFTSHTSNVANFSQVTVRDILFALEKEQGPDQRGTWCFFFLSQSPN